MQEMLAREDAMNCDEAFDLLTSPEGSGCKTLREHLAQCARCRDLQEAIAPALTMLDSPRSQRSSAVIAETAAARLNLVHAPRPRDPEWGWPLLKYTASLLVGIGLTWLAVTTLNRSTAAMKLSPVNVCLWQSHQAEAITVEQRSGDVVLTCVNCHLAGTSALNVQMSSEPSRSLDLSAVSR